MCWIKDTYPEDPSNLNLIKLKSWKCLLISSPYYNKRKAEEITQPKKLSCIWDERLRLIFDDSREDLLTGYHGIQLYPLELWGVMETQHLVEQWSELLWMKFPEGGVHGGDVQKVRAHNPQIQVDHFGHHWQCLLVLHHYVQSSCANDLKPFEHEELQHVALPKTIIPAKAKWS
jgi:hypothetical protein